MLQNGLMRFNRARPAPKIKLATRVEHAVTGRHDVTEPEPAKRHRHARLEAALRSAAFHLWLLR